MPAYRPNQPTSLGYVPIPKPRRPLYAETLRNLPEGQAALYEFDDQIDLQAAQKTVGSLALLKLGFRVCTRTQRTKDGKYQLYVWKRRPEDPEFGFTATLGATA